MEIFEIEIIEDELDNSAAKPSRFPWTKKNIDLMLDLYGK